MKNKHLIIAGAVLLGLALFYFGAFRGEHHSFVTRHRERDCTYHTSRQYFLGVLIAEKKWSDPPDAPSPPTSSGHLGPAVYWRGFGLLWKRTVHYQ